MFYSNNFFIIKIEMILTALKILILLSIKQNPIQSQLGKLTNISINLKYI